MRPVLVGALCAGLSFAATWQLAPQQSWVSTLAGSEVESLTRLAVETARTSTRDPSTGDAQTNSMRARVDESEAAAAGSDLAATTTAAPATHPAGMRSGDLNDMRKQAIDIKEALPAPVQKALRDVSNLRDTNDPDELARRVQALDPDQANLQQLRSFAEEFVDVPPDQIGEGRFARDQGRALGRRRR